jgi:hypothetical protein
MKIGKSQIRAIGLVLMFTASLFAGGCTMKSAKSDEMSSVLTNRSEAAAIRAEQASLKAEAAATRAEQAADRAEQMAEKAERIFQQKMKK